MVSNPARPFRYTHFEYSTDRGGGPMERNRGGRSCSNLLEDDKITTNASPEIKITTRPITHSPIPHRDACYIANEYIAKAMHCQLTEPLHPLKPKPTHNERFSAYCRRLHRQRRFQLLHIFNILISSFIRGIVSVVFSIADRHGTQSLSFISRAHRLLMVITVHLLVHGSRRCER